MNTKTVLILSVPLVGAALVAAAVAFRGAPESPTARKSPAPTRMEGSVQSAPPPPPLPKPAPEKTVSRAMDEARLKTTYQNYRTALATGNRVQADALYPVLCRERDAALRIAEQDLARSREDFDRTVASKVVEALRR